MGILKRIANALVGGEPHKEPDWQTIGYLDQTINVNDVDRGGKKIRSLQYELRAFLQIADQRRRVVFSFELVSVLDKSGLAQFWSFEQNKQLKAWEFGGPLPEGMTPLKISERKPAKLPEAIRHDYNNR